MGAAQSFVEQPEGYELYNCTLLRRMWSAGVYPELDDAGNSHPCSTPSHSLFILVVFVGLSVGCLTCFASCQLCSMLKDGPARATTNNPLTKGGLAIAAVQSPAGTLRQLFTYVSQFALFYVIYAFIMSPVFRPTEGLTYDDALSMLPPAPPTYGGPPDAMWSDAIEGTHSLYVAWAVLLAACLCGNCCGPFFGVLKCIRDKSNATADAEEAKKQGKVFKAKKPWALQVAMALSPLLHNSFLVVYAIWRIKMAPVYDRMTSERWMPAVPLAIGAGSYGIIAFFCTAVPMLVGLGRVNVSDEGLEMLKEQAEELDESIRKCLRNNSIALVSVAWLKRAGKDYLAPGARLPRRQELPPDALLSPEAAVAAYDSNALYVVSHGWLTPGHPDPYSKRLRKLLAFFSFPPMAPANPDGAGIFFDFMSLHQKPRDDEQEETFRSALPLMGRLYGSAHTTVLQIKEIPAKPDDHDATSLETLGPYNDRKYDDRGWCQLESGAAAIAAAIARNHKRKHVKLVELSGPTPKEKRPPTPSIAKLEAAIKDAKFTGKGDLPVVLDMIREFNTLLHAQAEALADE